MIPLQTGRGSDAQITIPFPGSAASEHPEQTEIQLFRLSLRKHSEDLVLLCWITARS